MYGKANNFDIDFNPKSLSFITFRETICSNKVYIVHCLTVGSHFEIMDT